MDERKSIGIDQFIAELKAQDVGRDDAALICPRCGNCQSIRSLMQAGASRDVAERVVHFNCEGRFWDERGCDWSLGGLLKIHKLEVDGQPSFLPATPGQAKTLKAMCDFVEVARG